MSAMEVDTNFRFPKKNNHYTHKPHRPALEGNESESTADKSVSSGSSQNTGGIVQGKGGKTKASGRSSRRKSMDLEGAEAENEATVRLFVYNQTQKVKESGHFNNEVEVGRVKQIRLPESIPTVTTASPPSVTMYPCVVSTPGFELLPSQTNTSSFSPLRSSSNMNSIYSASTHSSLFQPTSTPAGPRSDIPTGRMTKNKAIQNALGLEYNSRYCNRCYDKNCRGRKCSPDIESTPSSARTDARAAEQATEDRREILRFSEEDHDTNSGTTGLSRSGSSFSAFGINVTSLKNGIALENVKHVITSGPTPRSPVTSQADNFLAYPHSRIDGYLDDQTTNKATNIEGGCFSVNYLSLSQRLWGFLGLNERL